MEIKNQVYTKPHYSNGDILRCYGHEAETHVIENCVFELSTTPPAKQDEMLSCINGADVTIRNCVFFGGIKAILAGNGDHPVNDMKHGRLTMENCFIGWSGRRCPEVKHGVQAIMRNCWIHDWGTCFDTRAFGAWACDGGIIVAENCLFTRSEFNNLSILDSLKDRLNHVGFAVNRNGIGEIFKLRNYRSGLYRGLTAWSNGIVFASKCYRNSRDIIVENCNEFISAAEAVQIVQQIQDACPDTHHYMDETLMELWYSLF